MQHHKQKSGFALLISLIVVGVVVSIGLTILDVTVKQMSLSTNSKESESAFHAANAGLECIQHWRLKDADDFEVGDSVSVTCFGLPDKTLTAVSLPSGVLTPHGDLHLYETEFTWNSSAGDRCSEITMFIINSSDSEKAEVQGIKDIFPGYPYGPRKDCEISGRCTVTAVRGYNKSCSNKNTTGTIQREVLIES